MHHPYKYVFACIRNIFFSFMYENAKETESIYKGSKPPTHTQLSKHKSCFFKALSNCL